MSRLLKFAD